MAGRKRKKRRSKNPSQLSARLESHVVSLLEKVEKVSDIADRLATHCDGHLKELLLRLGNVTNELGEEIDNEIDILSD